MNDWLYSIVVYQTDFRTEAGAIPLGVVLFSKSGPQMRVRDLFPSAVRFPARTRMAVNALRSRLTTEVTSDDRTQISNFIQREGNEVRLTKVRTVRAVDAKSALEQAFAKECPDLFPPREIVAETNAAETNVNRLCTDVFLVFPLHQCRAPNIMGPPLPPSSLGHVAVRSLQPRCLIKSEGKTRMRARYTEASKAWGWAVLDELS